jgi:hypothetical protein
MSEATYYLNLLRLIVLWTAAAFASYFMLYENKYMEGSIFTFYYYEGITGVTASILTQLIYNCFKMRITFLITIGIVLFGTIGLLIISMQ